jgi:4-cresol dehydrogenase (hydroxylating)
MDRLGAASPASSPALAVGAGLRADRVLTTPAQLAPYLHAASGDRRRIGGVVLPETVHEVRAAVRAATCHRTPLYPISRGGNWGLGSRLPVRDGAVILDLRRLAALRGIDDERGIAVVEAGVTQGQLADALAASAASWRIDPTGSARGTSIVGNAVERGVGYAHARFDLALGLEIVLADGTLVHTGTWRLDDERIAPHRWGIGPAIDGLFSQSNLGVVTAMMLALVPVPDSERVFLCATRADGLRALVDGLAYLRRRGTVRSVVHIANATRASASLGGSVAPSRWLAIGSVDGTRRETRAAAAAIRRALRPAGRVVSLGATGRRLMHRASRMDTIHRPLRTLPSLLGLTAGEPTDAALLAAHAACGEDPVAGDPTRLDETAVGLRFCLPIVPLEGAAAVRAVKIAERVTHAHGFAAHVTLNTVTDFALEGVINVAFNRGEPERCRSAEACTRDLHHALREAGFPPYRVGIDQMDGVVVDGEPFWDLIASLKAALDPAGVLAPGRYGPG